MRLVGILGGTSWPSTVLPYRLLNEEVQRRLGGHHSARIALYSIDYHAIKSRYNDVWDEIPQLLKAEVERLLTFRPDCIMIANNTLHRAFDMIRSEINLDVPVFHAIELVRDHVLAQGFDQVLMLGTKFTMEDGFFAAPLTDRGVRVEIPGAAEREQVQAIQSRLATGEMDGRFAEFFRTLLAAHQANGCKAVITACTELPLVIDQSLTGMAVIDPLVLQTRACADFALG